MKVCILFQSDFPPEPRLSRTASVLLEQGHQVELFCDNRNGRPAHEIVEGIRTFRVKNVSPKTTGLSRLLRLPVFWNPIWLTQFLTFAKRGHFDVIHAINLPMAPLGLLVGRLFRIPVIYDMYENYPAAIRSWNLNGAFNRIFRNATAAEVLDKLCLRTVDHVIVVTEEAKERSKQLGVPDERISVVHNTADLQAIESLPISDEILQRYKRDFTIMYTGMLSPERGLETAITAMPIISSHIPSAKLVIVGGGPSEPSLRELAKTKNVQDCVEFTGRVDHKLFRSFIAAADICIVPHLANPFVNSTMPNKLFEYMAMGKPVVVSDAKPLARIVRECQCGAIFNSGSFESFAETILRVRSNGGEYGEKGKQAVYEKYNWSISSRALEGVYARIALTRLSTQQQARNELG